MDKLTSGHYLKGLFVWGDPYKVIKRSFVFKHVR